MNIDYKEKYFKYKTKFIELKKKQLGGGKIPPNFNFNFNFNLSGGEIPPGFNLSCYLQIMEMFGLDVDRTNPNFGNIGNLKYKIGGGEYTNITLSTINSEILRTNYILSEHEAENIDSDDNLTRFIVFRLVDKLNYPDQAAEFSIENCEDVIKLVQNNHFFDLFKIFLRKQTLAAIIPNVSNKILNAYRNPDRSIPPEFAVGSIKRSANALYEKQITLSADAAWSELTNFAKAIKFQN